MSDHLDLGGLDLTHRVVLLGVVELAASDETPVHAGDVRRTCAETLDALDGDVVGTLTEAEVARALNELDAQAVLDGSRDDTSPTGKGRPTFGLAADRDAVLDGLAADDRLASLVSRANASD